MFLMISRGNHPQLKALSLFGVYIPGWRTESFVKLLKQMPTLVCLTLDNEPTGIDPDSRFSLSDLPNLRDLTCPQSFLFCLAGTHNLSRLPLFCRGTRIRPLVPLASRSQWWLNVSHYGTISQLVVPFSLAFSITSDPAGKPAMRALKELIVFGTYADDDLDRDAFLKSFVKFQRTFATPSLRKLHFTQFVSRGVAILAKEECFPGLQYFSFWFLHEDGRWDFMKECSKAGDDLIRLTRIGQDEYDGLCQDIK
ncbi:hypothetical protein GYMLUDRAFT_690588 [Collybiopsis luxurians FD-317 M1]|uniref:Unplaced genomic scaffold GYMLUscaffold_35, whole genome shotgun sequence n=1 Tax=Collybiopsis luxurians FD-317 M1 TaxID=944289 RepID=A0A0D0CSX3_9AGAR|nr:hypothetical protein GYMLUDRAFT_690588 [Collybiopsis luxurians FD-317 M1]